MSTRKPKGAWPFEKLTVTPSPRVPRMDIEPLDLVDHQPVVCVVCGGQRTRPTDSQAEPRPCNVCGGQGQIGGGA